MSLNVLFFLDVTTKPFSACYLLSQSKFKDEYSLENEYFVRLITNKKIIGITFKNINFGLKKIIV